jgi:hypothetical protein
LRGQVDPSFGDLEIGVQQTIDPRERVGTVVPHLVGSAVNPVHPPNMVTSSTASMI